MTRKSVSLPGIAVIVTLAMFAFSGDFYWNCYGDNSSNTNPPPPTRSITSVTEIKDPLTAANQRNGPCYYDGSQNNTQPHLWHIHYSDNTATDAPILWPWNKTTRQVGTLKYYVTGDTPFDVGNAVDAAVRGWNSALTRDVHYGGTINLTLVKSTDPYSPVTVYGATQSGNLSLNPDEAGAEAFGSIPAPYTTINNAQILISPNAGTDNNYGIAMHEIGHSLGLDHNIDKASVMWPSENSCFPTDTVPQSIDTSFLEDKYDPTYIDKTYGDGSNCIGTRCYLSRRRSTDQGLKGMATLTVPHVYASAGAAAAARRGKPFAMTGYSGPTFHVHLEDSLVSRTISLEGLTLASSLVATVDVMRTVRYVSQGPVRYAIRAAKIRALERHALGPDEGTKVGDTIYFADREFGNGESFLDDPALYPGSRAIVFLQRYDQGAKRLGIQNLYRFTARSISKLGLYRDGRLAQLAAYQSRVMTDVDGKTVNDLYRSALSRYGPVSMRSEESALRAALTERGIRTPQQVEHYRQTLSVPSVGVTRWAASTERQSRAVAAGR